MATHERRSIVTGGTRGIGYATAQALVAEGGRVMLSGRDAVAVDAAVRRLSDEAGDGSRIGGMAIDIRDRVAVELLVAETARRFGGLDALVNNAGVGVFTDAAAMSDADWDRVIDTNLTGPFYATRAAIPELRRAGGGWIINIASLAGRNYFPGGSAYCASKAGLIAFSEAVMQEVRYDGIRVSVIMPGSVATEFNGATPGPDDDWKLSPDDVAQAVMDLLRHPGRSLPSRVELRPSQPRKR
ncbi:MAG TPA: SDR family oxidoreductase [Vicinamibacterales bacterium]|nr:SDR family oxidoreductase [Vicinamibacterales bacterium]